MSAKKRKFIIFLAIVMVITSLPASVFAANDFNYGNLQEEKSKFLNKEPVKKPAELGADPTTKEEANAQIKNSKMPKLYTIKAEYKAIKDGEAVHLFEPYTATVGDDEYTYIDSKGVERKVISEEEKAKIKRDIKLPDIDGYSAPTPKTDINYSYVKEKAKAGYQNGDAFTALHPYYYKPNGGEVRVKHVFQDLYNKNKYGLKDGANEITYTRVEGFVGSKINVQPLSLKERKGYVPEKTVIVARIPDNKDDVVIEYRYNRDSFAITYDMDGGFAVPAQKLYYGQTIPNLNLKPEKIGAIFQGWKVNIDLNYKTATGEIKTIPKNTKFDMKDFPDGIKDAMPAQDIKFTALWKEKPKANYTIQFWTQRADSDGYDYLGAKVVRDADTGSRPDLLSMMPEGIKFPEIDKELTNTGREKELNKYYVRNDEKIVKENSELVEKEDGTKTSLTKKIQSDDKTTYNIYYDRQTYNLLFEKFCVDNPEQGYPALEAKMVLPDGTKYDSTKEVNNPYSFQAKFGERLKKWPNDMWLIEEGGVDFPEFRSFLGWQLNYKDSNNEDMSMYLDTPPYWLTSKDFIDKDFDPLGYGSSHATESTSTGEPLPPNTISLGPASSEEFQFAIYYMEYLVEGFDGEFHFDPDLSYTKIDTDSQYSYPAPGIVGLKPKFDAIDPIDELHKTPAQRDGQTEDLSKASYDELGDRLDAAEKDRPNNEKSFFEPFSKKEVNGVPFKDIPKYRFRFTYYREKHNIFLDTDPSDINENAYFAGKKTSSGKPLTVEDVKFGQALRRLNLDKDYVLTENDRPASVPKTYVFKGWALDPEGRHLIKDTIDKAEDLENAIQEKYAELAKNYKDKEKKLAIKEEINDLKVKLDEVDALMPNYDITVYAKWGEPDINYKVKFDPNEGDLSPIEPNDIASHEDKEVIKTSTENIIYTYPEKEADEGKIQVFSVKNRTSIKEPMPPKRKGYDFLGWELVRYKEDGSVDNSYMKKYGVPELYAFGNEVVGDIYLKAIWVENQMIDIDSFHYFFDEDFNEIIDKRKKITVEDVRVGEYAQTNARFQGEKNLLIPGAELDKLAEKSNDYKEYVDKTGRKNTYYQIFRVEPDKIEQDGNLVDNPKAENNIFKFFYREFKKRHFKINYLSTFEEDAETLPAIGEKPQDSYKIIDTEEVTDSNTHFDAVNYREIPGWKLISTPQRQLFFEFDANGEMDGINGVKSSEVNFYYKDVRVIKRKDKTATSPDGYHRVIFRAGRDGSFGLDADGNPIKELVYDVIDGLEFRNIPVPPQQNPDNPIKTPVITPDKNAEFVEWNDSRLLDDNTSIRRDYTFTAKFRPLNDVVEITTGNEKVQDYFVDVYVDSTDKADGEIEGNQFTGGKIKHYKVNPEKEVTIPVLEPKGGVVKDKNGNPIINSYGVKQYWQFKQWEVDNNRDKIWSKGQEIKDKFTQKTTTIVAKYNMVANLLEPIPMAKSISVFESYKDEAGNWVNNFLPTKDQFDKALEEVMKLDGFKEYKLLESEDEIYDLIKEAGKEVGDDQPREIKLKVEVTFENGRKAIVNMPIKVFNNIYRGLNNGDKPDVVKNNEELKDFVTVTVNPTDLAKDKQKKVYYVNPDAEVVIPEGDPTGVDNYTFEGWYYIDPTKISEDNPKGRVKIDLTKRNMIPEDMEIFALYSRPLEPIVPLKPEAKRIVKNIGDSLTVDDYEEAITPPKDDKGNDLKKIKTVKIVNPKDQRVTTDNPGSYKEKVEVIYEDGSSYIIDVDVLVVPNYIEQVGEDKPDVPDYFIKVIVDYTDRAMLADGQAQRRIFWVNPNVKVDLPVDKPVGKTEKDKKISWKFDYWHVDEKDGKHYDQDISDIFKKEVTIKAHYYVKAEPMITAVKYIEEKMIPKGGDISAKDFITNLYNDDDPNNKDNLPPGTKISFIVPPDTNLVGKQPAKIKITYPGGEEVIIEVKINVIDDVVPQEGDDKPEVPKNYVKVIVNYTDKAKLSEVEKVEQVYWVNPEKVVKILDSDPIGIENWTFEGWTSDKKDISLTKGHQFTAPVTYVKAIYSYKPVTIQPLEPETNKVYTYVGKLPNEDEYIEKIKVPEGMEIDHIEIIENPDVTKSGDTSAKIKIFYKDGSSVGSPEDPVIVDVVVKENIYPADTNGNRTKETPDNYVRVVVDPTEKAKDSQKKVYYVNPEADVKLDINNPDPIDHWNFLNWSSEGENFEPGKAHRFENATIIKAKYEKDPLLTFIQVYSDGTLKAKESKYVKKGSKVNAPENIVKGRIEGDWMFKAWYKDAKLDKLFDFSNTSVEEDLTIYGVWNKLPQLKVKDITIPKGKKLDLKSLIVKAEDLEDGDLSNKVELISDGGFDSNKPGKYEITFKLVDKDGGVTIAKAIVEVVEASKPSKPDKDVKKPSKPNDGNGSGDKTKQPDKSKAPRTGDNLLSQYNYILGISLGVLLVVLLTKKRVKKND